jgi:hypothetical protein
MGIIGSWSGIENWIFLVWEVFVLAQGSTGAGRMMGRTNIKT